MNRSLSNVNRIFSILGVFCIAMGILEAIVAVYLRQIYYPNGFDFPLILLSPQMILIEWIREAATIVMLAAIGIMVGKNNLQRFFYFLFCFAIWDIFYYVGLKLFLNWPASFLTWDVLFLIPVPWISPVLAPVICSITMILFGGGAIYFQERGYPVQIKPFQWVFLFLGSLFILVSFMWDYSRIIIQNGFVSDFLTLSENEHFWQIISGYKPTYYNWILFSIGELILFYVIIQVFRVSKSIH